MNTKGKIRRKGKRKRNIRHGKVEESDREKVQSTIRKSNSIEIGQKMFLGPHRKQVKLGEVKEEILKHQRVRGTGIADRIKIGRGAKPRKPGDLLVLEKRIVRKSGCGGARRGERGGGGSRTKKYIKEGRVSRPTDDAHHLTVRMKRINKTTKGTVGHPESRGGRSELSGWGRKGHKKNTSGKKKSFGGVQTWATAKAPEQEKGTCSGKSRGNRDMAGRRGIKRQKEIYSGSGKKKKEILGVINGPELGRMAWSRLQYLLW